MFDLTVIGKYSVRENHTLVTNYRRVATKRRPHTADPAWTLSFGVRLMFDSVRTGGVDKLG
jgi:hypothetical protein